MLFDIVLAILGALYFGTWSFRVLFRADRVVLRKDVAIRTRGIRAATTWAFHLS